MKALVKDKFLYIQCPKNGLMTYQTLLKKHGWSCINLFENDLNLNEYFMWGHITDPETRHTRGVVQYLISNPKLSIKNPTVAAMLVSGVFDEHTYSLNMMLGKLMHYPIYWIPLDAKITNWLDPTHPLLLGDDLTNEFFNEHNINVSVSIQDRKNISNPNQLALQQQVNECKLKYNSNYKKLVKNFLEQDIILYNKTVQQFRKKYGSNE